ncbi:uncharacterized protein LOC135940986 [Cloeon dipterum]|uniref:uncharacterized protein LOC135940986 n=1 Tax=Cloeon dipterum TaxID=197152 RepID=UPI00321FA0EE
MRAFILLCFLILVVQQGQFTNGEKKNKKKDNTSGNQVSKTLSMGVKAAKREILKHSSGQAQQCYNCASANDAQNCADPFKSTNIPMCTLDSDTSCMKAVFTIDDGEGNMNKIVVRSCAPSSLADPCSTVAKEFGNFAKLEHCSTCDSSDFCNSGPKSAAVSAVGLASVVMLALKNLL